jgi:CRP/FNR family transcriptional regulator, cyclic AMP receptor protein
VEDGVAGTVRILKPGEILFRTGEKADSMFIIRRGSLKVYALKESEEVQLALLSDGAIVGEMAFFDQKPRSAHVKALTQTEITEITRADFDKLLTQIPRWLVTMLQSLSGRLRSTNEKLLQVEKYLQGSNGASDVPLTPLVRTLRILQLLIVQIGQKDGTQITLDQGTALEWWMMLTGWSRDYFLRFMVSLHKMGVVQKRGEGAQKIVLTGRPRLQAFTEFVAEIQPRITHELLGSFAPVWVEMLEAAIAEAQQSGYENYNVSVVNLSTSNALKELNAEQKIIIGSKLSALLALKYTQSSTDFLIKINPKQAKNQLILLNMFWSCISDRLDRLE